MSLMKYFKLISVITIVITASLWFSYERKKFKSIHDELTSVRESITSRNLEEKSHLNANLVPMREPQTKAFVKSIDTLLVSKERLWTAPPNWQPPRLTRADRIAHAGGGYNGISYTNSLEALEANKNDFNLFEIDLAFTSDEKLVCSHDWDHYPKQIFGFDIGKVPSYEDFTILAQQNKRFTNCTLESLIKWLDDNPHASVVTDVKKQNIKALEYIAKNFSNHTFRFIPQIYNLQEYQPVLEMGFEKIILTIYGWQAPEAEIVAQVKGKKLFAITVPDYRAPYIGKPLKDIGYRVYTHTVNTKETKDLMRWFGVDEIYTDFYKD